MSNGGFHHGKDSVLPLDRLTIFFDGQYSEPRLHHPEAVAVGPDGMVWCGNAEGDILRIDPVSRKIDRIASTGGFTLGLAFDRDAHLYACDQRTAAVWRLDLDTGELARFTPPGIRIPNYPVVDPSRRCLYVSDSYGAGTEGPGVWRYDLTTGQGDLWWSEPMNFANGMALSSDGAALFVVETFGRRVSRIPIDGNGMPDGIEVFVDNLPGLPDGVALDERGHLFVSCYEPSRILRIDGDRNVAVYAEDTEAHLLCHPTNIAFDGSIMYAANLGRWHLTKIETDTHAPRLASAAKNALEPGVVA